MTTLEEHLSKLSPEHRQGIEQRAQEIIAENRSWRSLRMAARKSREIISRKLGTNREETFELQQKTDLMLYSFAKQVKAQGGKVQIVAEFPNSPTVTFPNFDYFDDGLTDEESIRQTLGMEPDEPIPPEWLQHPLHCSETEQEQTNTKAQGYRDLDSSTGTAALPITR